MLSRPSCSVAISIWWWFGFTLARPEALRHIRFYAKPMRIATGKTHPVLEAGITSLHQLVDNLWILPSHEVRLPATRGYARGL